MDIEAIKNLIIDNRVAEAINLWKTFSPDEQTITALDLNLSRFLDIQNKEILGTISYEESRVNITQIQKNLLELLSHKKDGNVAQSLPNSSRKSKTKLDSTIRAAIITAFATLFAAGITIIPPTCTNTPDGKTSMKDSIPDTIQKELTVSDSVEGKEESGIDEPTDNGKITHYKYELKLDYKDKTLGEKIDPDTRAYVKFEKIENNTIFINTELEWNNSTNFKPYNFNINENFSVPFQIEKGGYVLKFIGYNSKDKILKMDIIPVTDPIPVK